MASLSGLSAVGAWRRSIGEPEKPPCPRAQRMVDQQATLRKTIADAAEQRPQLVVPPPFRPRRQHRAEMDAEKPYWYFRRHHFDVGVLRQPRPVPGRADDRRPAHVTERLAWKRAPIRHSGQRRDLFDDVGARRFLKEGPSVTAPLPLVVPLTP